MANVQSDAQGIQNILHSIAPDAVQKVTPEALQRLSEKLSELMGEDVVRNGADQGLPLVDITEPGSSKSSEKEASLEEPPLIPLSLLSPSERTNYRIERDRILDKLEQEEEEEQRKADEVEGLERQAALEKRRKAAKAELDQMEMMKETHKKMGKALMRSMAGARENEEAELKKEQEDSLAHQPVAGTTSSEKKTVKFADGDGDSKGKLGASPRPNRTSTDSEHLMKRNVVERIPGSGRIVEQPKMRKREADSDDESETEHPPDSDSDQDNPNADQDLEEDELDLDIAFHQREIALAYQEKRGKVGEEAAISLTSHSHEPGEEPSTGKSRTPVSKFRANRLASAYATSTTSSSKSLGASIIPAVGADILQRAIRMGNIDESGRLVGGELESEDEDNATMHEQEQEAVQEVLELLKKGQVYNMGPDDSLHTVPPEKTKKAPFTMPTEPPPSSAKHREKIPSKFKLAKRGASTISSEVSGSSTPLSTVDRSSPKLLAVAAPSSHSMGNVVVDSPSFPNAGSMVTASSSFSSPATLQRPPAIMAAVVKEKEISKANDSKGEAQPPPSSDQPTKRISRFKADRM